MYFYCSAKYAGDMARRQHHDMQTMPRVDGGRPVF